MSSEPETPRSFFAIASPVGHLTMTASAGLIDGLTMDGQRHAPPSDPTWVRDEAPFTELISLLERYFEGQPVEFDIPVSFNGGTDFQRRVWGALRDIPHGETISYGELARRVGSPGGARAVGLANGRNPIAIIVPCHRVIGADGSLTGYGGGVERKAWLLRHEAGVRELGETDANLLVVA
jgi:methylated-DNA-[protein]-cysteine S-methyltransferase